MYDVIVVGARCGGSPTAMLLARKGHSVLLVDKTTFPSDTISTHYLHQMSIARLKRWGLLDTVMASNCPPIRGLMFDVGVFQLIGTPPPVDGVAEAYSVRRIINRSNCFRRYGITRQTPLACSRRCPRPCRSASSRISSGF